MLTGMDTIKGIWLSGGGSLLRGIARRFSEKVNIVFRLAENPLKAVARGTCLALKGTDNYPFSYEVITALEKSGV